MNAPVRTTFALLAALIITAAMAAGCGGSNGNASSESTKDAAAIDQVCTARDDLSAAVRTVVSDLQAGNFGTAKSGLTAVSSALDDLNAAVGKLGSEERTKLQPQVDELRTHLQAAGNASTLTELRSALAQAGTTATQLASSIHTDLHCPAAG